MNTLKKWIGILVTIVIIIVISLVYVYITKKRAGIDEQPIESTYVYNGKIKEVSIRNNYYIVESCINKFYTYCTSIYKLGKNENYIQQKNKTINAVYNMLDEEYIKYKDITIDNLESKLPEMEKMSININKMYVSEKDQNIEVYFAYGKLIDISSFKTYNFSMMLKVDRLNHTFTILLEDYINEKYGNIEIGKNIEINWPEEIEDKGNNKFDYNIIDDKEYITDVFKKFRDNMIFDRQTAYEALNEEYRNKRFPTFEEFEKYIKANIREITIMDLSKYKKQKNDGKVQYICEDTKNKNYIINETTTRNCNFILDTYTIDLPEFIEEYNAADNETRVALNIEKLREAINSNDYKYVYNQMDATFRENKFKDYSEFENYLKSKLYEKNDFEYQNIEKQADLYVATVNVTNLNEKYDETRQMKIIMQFTDGVGYSISFNFGE